MTRSNTGTNPSAADELASLDATAQAELVRRGELKPQELVERAIQRIERLDPQLNAVIHRHFERAVDAAGEALPAGPFRGVPFLLKDLGCSNRAGDPWHWGTRFLRDADFRAPTTAALVERFERAGFVVVGRTNVPELGAWTTTEPESTGATCNPWDPSRSCGGSSGGSAAAVASGMVPAAHANDGGGSIRNPASQSGLIGLKPTRGRISLGPDIGEDWAGMTFEFAVTRSVRDTAALLDAVAGNEPGDPYVGPPPSRPWSQEVGADPGRLRVGLWQELAGHGYAVAPECREAVSRTATLLEELGHHVEDAQPEGLDDPALQHSIVHIISACQAQTVDTFARALGREIGPEDMDCDNWTVTEIGRGVTASQYLDAVRAHHRFHRRVAAWWQQGFDLLLTPTIPEVSPPLGELVPDPAQPLKGFLRSGQLTAFLIPFNITGQPAISLPLHWSDGGLPVGVQLVAGFGREDLLLRVAAQLEAARPWRERQPGIFG